MVVTALRPLSKTGYAVDVDGTFAFALYKQEIQTYALEEDCEISGEVYQEIRALVQKRAKRRALYLLEQQDRTEAALREKLVRGHYTQEIADEAVAYVKSFGYLDDRRAAENYVRGRKKNKSRRELREALLKKGVPSELAAEVLETSYSEEEERDAVRFILQKKNIEPACMDEDERQRICGYLQRKGFGYKSIKQVL